MIGWPVEENKFPFKVAYEELGLLYSQIKKQARIPVTFVPENINYTKFYSFNDLTSDSRCLSPWNIATLLPDGSLTSCQEYILGNIKENSFMSLWNGHLMKKFRTYRKRQPFPACFRCLEGQEIKIK